MKAIILTAGFGTRILPLTTQKPKALLPIVNQPIIDIIISNLKNAGVTQLGVNLHHLGDQIQAYLKDERLGVKIYYRHEEKILETGGGLAHFKDFIGSDESFIVHNCDILTDIDLNEAVAFHKNMHSIVTMVCINRPPHNTVLVDKHLRVRDIGGKLAQDAEKEDKFFSGAGIFIYNSDIFKRLKIGSEPYPVIPVVLELIKENPGSVAAYIPQKKFYWKDIGDTVAYIDAHSDILKKKIISFPGVSSPKGAFWFDKTALIDEGAEIKGFASVGKGARILKGAKIEDCVIWENAVVGCSREISGAVITTRFCTT